MKANTVTWFALVALSALSFSVGGRSLPALVLTAAGLKSALLGWRFMELHTAAPVWKAAFLSLLVVLLTLIYLLH